MHRHQDTNTNISWKRYAFALMHMQKGAAMYMFTPNPTVKYVKYINS